MQYGNATKQAINNDFVFTLLLCKKTDACFRSLAWTPSYKVEINTAKHKRIEVTVN